MTTTPQVQVVSLYGGGPGAHLAQCRCGWRYLSKTKERLTDKLTQHFLESSECYDLSEAQVSPQEA